MSNIEAIVDSLEDKINKILNQLEVLRQTKAKLEEELEKQQQIIEQQKETIDSWAEKYETLKIANSLLGSNENNRETKLKINALIRDIDYCITQLAE